MKCSNFILNVMDVQMINIPISIIFLDQSCYIWISESIGSTNNATKTMSNLGLVMKCQDEMISTQLINENESLELSQEQMFKRLANKFNLQIFFSNNTTFIQEQPMILYELEKRLLQELTNHFRSQSS